MIEENILPKTIQAIEDYKSEIHECKNYQEIIDVPYPTSLYLTFASELYNAIRVKFEHVRAKYNSPSLPYDDKEEMLNYTVTDVKAVHLFRAEAYIVSAMHTQTIIDIVVEQVNYARSQNTPYSTFLKNLTLESYEPSKLYYLLITINLALNQVISSANWLNFQEEKDAYPYLKYNSKSVNESECEHLELDGFVKSLDDPFWDKFYPPNSVKCNCYVEQISESDYAKLLTNKQVPATIKSVPEEFQKNVGKDFSIFCDWTDGIFPD